MDYVHMSCFSSVFLRAPGYQDTGTLEIQASCALGEPFLGHTGTIIVTLLEGLTKQISIKKGIRTLFNMVELF